MKIVIAGVSGSGKSTIGRLVADKLGCGFADADDFHPPENIAKMSAGIPLDDADRAGWLEALGRCLAGHDDLVLACSALKRAYRDKLRSLGGPVKFLVLAADREVLEERLGAREHFMPASLLDSQLSALELGDDVEVIANETDPSEVAAKVLSTVLQS